ncbi:conserved protein of unknown function (plasmid) [Rhodovastum atsumiense]|uniref:Uncharacterized protein n=1 Tax=Rhodovastum atsumiense TaxID=504468 RepID=A0A5M6ITI5_9PROT|nr:hypothetical protein [Rhodovastum atsumiense]KAA5611572.1 hypothetical protein F1189_13490 [Rhodovastum atsumiense]CAH2606345.1 conserved protein of unknown function [Rhodovastum atsumiense]
MIVERFAEVGANLLRLAAQLARDTRGTFADGAAPALGTVIAYSEAARNGFQVLAADPGMSEMQRLIAGEMAVSFSKALGTIATRFGQSATMPTLEPLREDAPPPLRAALADMFATDPGPVTVTPGALAALDSLRRDPLTLASAGAAAVVQLMAAASEGVVIAQ